MPRIYEGLSLQPQPGARVQFKPELPFLFIFLFRKAFPSACSELEHMLYLPFFFYF